MPRSLQVSPNCWLANYFSLYEISFLGILKRHTTFFQRKVCTLWTVITATGSTSIHFVKYSIATIRYFNCRIAWGKGPRMSIPQVWNEQRLNMECSSSAGSWCQSACFWHCSHLFTYMWLSSFNVGQKYLARVTLRERAFPPMWLLQMPSCSLDKIRFSCFISTQVRSGWEYPFLNRCPSIIVYRLAFLRMTFARSTSVGRILLARYKT